MSKTGLDPPTLVKKKFIYFLDVVFCPGFDGLRLSVTENIMLFFILHDKFITKKIRGVRGVL